MNAERQSELFLASHTTDTILKDRAKFAYTAYEAHVRDGNTELAAAALKRFQDASAALAPSQKGER